MEAMMAGEWKYTEIASADVGKATWVAQSLVTPDGKDMMGIRKMFTRASGDKQITSVGLTFVAGADQLENVQAAINMLLALKNKIEHPEGSRAQRQEAEIGPWVIVGADGYFLIKYLKQKTTGAVRPVSTPDRAQAKSWASKSDAETYFNKTFGKLKGGWKVKKVPLEA